MNGHLFRAARFATWVALLALLFVLAAAGNPPGVSAAMSAPVFAPSIPAAALVNTDGTLNLATGISGTLDLRGWDVTVDSNRGPILTRSITLNYNQPPALPPAVPPHKPSVAPPTAWNGLLDTGLNNAVNAIAVSGNDVYVGGNFTQSYNGNYKDLNYIARYRDGMWHALANKGLGGRVNAIAVGTGGEIFVGGQFTTTGDGTVPDLNNIAAYDTNTSTWSALDGHGLNGSVAALAFQSSTGDLWVGGSFTGDVLATKSLYHIARFNLGWNPVGSICTGLNADVDAIVVFGTSIYVGGFFSGTHATAAPCNAAPYTNLNKIAKLSGGTAWNALAHGGLFGQAVIALAVSGTDVYVGGSFDRTFDGNATYLNKLNNLAIYSDSSGAWIIPANNGLSTGVPSSGNVNSLAVIGTDVYVGGTFTQSYDAAVTNLKNLAIYRSDTWVATPDQGLNFNGGGGSVNAIAFMGTTMPYNAYAGGSFAQTGDGIVKPLNFIAVLANVCTAISGVWNSAGTWDCGGIPTSADSVTIPNGVTVQLGADTTVNGTFTLDGTIDANGHIFNLGPNANVNGTGLVTGTVERYTVGAGTLTFNNANTQITFNGGNTPSNVAVTLTMGNPSGMTNSVGRTFTITPGPGSFTSATLRLPYNPTQFSGITNEANLKLWRYDTGSSRWVLQGGVVDTINKFVELTGVTGFSQWTISDNGAPTAVTLSKFDANADGGPNIVIVVSAALACVAIAGVWVARTRRS